MEQFSYCLVVDSLAPHMGKKGGQSSGATLLGGLMSPQRCMYIVGAQMLLTPPMSTSLVLAGALRTILVACSISGSGLNLVPGLGGA